MGKMYLCENLISCTISYHDYKYSILSDLMIFPFFQISTTKLRDKASRFIQNGLKRHSCLQKYTCVTTKTTHKITFVAFKKSSSKRHCKHP